MEHKTRTHKNDIILIAVILVVAVILLFVFYKGKNEQGDQVVVLVDGEVYAKYPLNEDLDTEIQTSYGSNRLVIANGVADMTQADCPDHVCVDMKSISKNGETIVCLPHKLVVEIESSKAADFDSVTQ